MRTILTLAVAFLVAATASAQDGATAKLPSVKLKNIAGAAVNTADLGADGKPVIVSFWATWCKPCIQEITTYNDLLQDWQTKYGATIVAVSIDDSRNVTKVGPLVKGRNWQFDVLLDVNGDFKRAMNVNNVPHTFLVHNGKIVWQHAAYAPGDEDHLEEQLKLIVAGKDANAKGANE